MSLDAAINRALTAQKPNAPFWEQPGGNGKKRDPLGDLTPSQRAAAKLMDQAVTLLRFRQFPAAVPVLLKAVSLWPTNAEIQFHCGAALMEVGQLQKALERFDLAAQLKPRWSDAWNNRSVALSRMGRIEEAMASAEKALECSPNVAAYANLCAAYSNMGDSDKAVQYGEQAVRLSNGTTALALINYGVSLRAQWRLEEAAGSQIRAIETSGGQDYMAWSNLGAIRNLQGKNHEALAVTQRAVELMPGNASLASNMIMFADLLPETTLLEAYARRRHWALTYEEPLKRGWREHHNDRTPDRRLKVGYVGADFRQHSAANTHGAIIRAHDPEQVAVYVYAGNRYEDHISALIREAPALAEWVMTGGTNDLELAERIYRDQIDILVDVASHTAGGRLITFACKPAPIQISAWGYANGTGLDAMDVFIADEVLVPPELEYGYRESVVKMSSLFCFDPFIAIDPPNHSPPVQRNGYVTFGSLNRVEKISAPILELWCQVLHKVPNSKMVLKFGGLMHDDGRETETAGRLKDDFVAQGIDRERIITLGHTERSLHLQQYAEIDILLDTWPHVGGITTLEGAMCGVPCVTLLGDRAPSRVSASILTQMGLTDWVAATPNEYVEIAVAKAGQDLTELRASLPERLANTSTGDPVRYTRELEDVYRNLWQAWASRVAAETRVEEAA